MPTPLSSMKLPKDLAAKVKSRGLVVDAPGDGKPRCRGFIQANF